MPPLISLFPRYFVTDTAPRYRLKFFSWIRPKPPDWRPPAVVSTYWIWSPPGKPGATLFFS